MIMSSARSISTVAIILLVVGLVIGGGGGYYFSTNISQSRISGYESQISDLTEEVSILSSTVSKLEANNSLYVSQLALLQTQISDLEELVTTHEDEISELESKVSDYEGQISSLESDLEEAEDEIADYQEWVSVLDSRLSYFRMLLESYYESNPIRIGVTISDIDKRATVQAVVQIAKDEINQYSQAEGLPFKFEFVIKDNYGSDVEAVDNIVSFNASGINLVIGHGTSSQTSLSLLHVNARDMLMLSPSANSRQLAIAGDNLFRTCPTDLVQAPILAKAIAKWGIKGLIVIQRGDEWGDGIYEAFRKEFEARGGTIVKRIRYDPAAEILGGTLNTAETAAKDAITKYGADRVAVEVIGLDEVSSMIDMAKSFPTVYGLYWFGSSGTTSKLSDFSNVATEADHLKLFGPILVQEENTEYLKFSVKYTAIMGKPPDFYASAMYDAAWLYALSVIQTWSTNTYQIKYELPLVAHDYYGASGLCRMDDYGDRLDVDHEILGYAIVNNQLKTVKYGYYDVTTGQVTWYSGLGINPPG